MNKITLKHKRSHKCLEIYSDLHLPLPTFKQTLHAAGGLKRLKFYLVILYFLQ